ncbi:TetR/AcrR family transcriptional regulator [Brevundimonas diminuta]|jgi:AcrR family transcriptional regulator|uniref:TetR/AcrR family transcriptional regulator n=1 Tax=Brevundimonas diminuta TaxID=293 RepID=UPI00320B64D8
MPRALGQIDEYKSRAILRAAAELFREKGAKVSMAEVARRAGVSKQTLYNRYPTKTAIARDLAAQRSEETVAPLASNLDVETALAALAETLIRRVCIEGRGVALRGMALASPESPELARAVYDAGPGQNLRRLAVWLEEQDRLGRLSAPDPAAAAEMFTGMVLGHGHLRSVLGLPHPAIDDIPARAREAARRFVRAFAPE